MDVKVLLWITVVILLIAIFISEKLQRAQKKKLDALNKLVRDKELEIERNKADIWKRNQEIQNLKNKVADIKKNENFALDMFSSDKEDLEKILRIIERDYSITIASKKYLIKLLAFFLITNHSMLSIEDLKTNKKTLMDNTKTLRRYIIYGNTASSNKERLEIGNALLSLILYNKRSKDK